MDQKQQQHDQQSRRSKWSENQDSNRQQQPPPPPPPEKCPRCDSLNTKFCYYNNYSLSQPRYFCKTCRRYWTQGGTLRNVPVGGGCRKGKRPRATSSSAGESSRSQPLPSPPPPPPQQQLTNIASIVSTLAGLPTSQFPWAHARSDGIACIRAAMIQPHATSSFDRIPSISAGIITPGATSSSIYPSGGILSSLAAMQSLTQHQGINQAIDLTGGFAVGSSSAGDPNISLLHGFNFPLMKPQLSQQAQLQQASGFQGKDEEEKNDEPLYQNELNLGQPARNLSSWNQRDNLINPSPSNINFWNSTSGSSSDGMPGSSLNANPWPNLPGYGGPP